MDPSKYKVLFIEDDEIDRMAFERKANKLALPYDITAVPSISKAKVALESNPFDIIIADYNLSDGTAFEILDLIKDIPVVFATGIGNEETAAKALRAGAYDYLIKDRDRNYLEVLPMIIDKAIDHNRTEKKLKEYHDGLEAIIAKRTEELAKEKELLDITMSSMSDAIIALNVEMRIVLFNRVAEQMTGLKFQDVEGKFIGNVLAVVDDNTKEPVDDIIGKILNADADNPNKGNYTLIHKNGTEYAITCNASVMSVDENSIMGTVLAFRDVTKEREIDQMKTDFVSSVSHELKTPLTSIKAFTTTILSDVNMTDKTRRQFLGIIDKESNRLAELIEDLLEMSRIESGSLQVSMELIDISDVFNQTAISLEALAAKEHIKLVKNIPETLPLLTADPGKLRSVITNLVSNAAKFTPDGGRVDIKARQTEDELKVTVSDTGMGIPQEDLPKIFDRFYRVDRPGKEIQGTGLGLAIVKKIVEMHNGRIEVRSKVNEGTTFTIYLPLAKEAATV